MTRKIILMMSVSLDGFFEGPNRELDWHLVDNELHAHFNEQLGAMGAFLDGRVTYELMAGFWPTADTDPSSTGPVVEFARIWLDMPPGRHWTGQAVVSCLGHRDQSPARGDPDLRQRGGPPALPTPRR